MKDFSKYLFFKEASPLKNRTLNTIDRLGLVVKIHSGIFFWTPLGEKIKARVLGVVREKMDELGFETESPFLVERLMFEKSKRSENFKAELLSFAQYSLAPTAEEVYALMERDGIFMYQITPKFRNELRPRNLIIRSRLFNMKDGYSFSSTIEGAIGFYHKVKEKYIELFRALGLGLLMPKSDPSSMCGVLSHEFFLPSEVVEDRVFTTRGHKKDFFNENTCLLNKEDGFEETVEGIELAHIFLLGDHFSKTINERIENPMYMNSYGIGIDRLVFAVLEKQIKEFGMLRFPFELAPMEVVFIVKDEQSIDMGLFKSMELRYELDLDYRSSLKNRIKKYEQLGIPLICVLEQDTAKLKLFGDGFQLLTKSQTLERMQNAKEMFSKKH